MQPAAFAKVLILTAFAAWFISLVIVPAVRWLACRIGLVDSPDPTRKLHRGQIALGGGIAVFATVAFVAFMTDRLFIPSFNEGGLPWSTRWTALACAALATLLLGMIDDRYPLRGKSKLIVQVMIVFGLGLFWQPS